MNKSALLEIRMSTFIATPLSLESGEVVTNSYPNSHICIIAKKRIRSSCCGELST